MSIFIEIDCALTGKIFEENHKINWFIVNKTFIDIHF